LTQVFEIASSSVAVKPRVTGEPSLTGLGKTLVIVTVGAKSLTVSVVVLEVVRPAASVAFTVIVKIFWATPPVL
jgi:hypothetical protein